MSIDGVCLTATEILSENRVAFDVIAQSLAVTTLGDYHPGSAVNCERAAKDGAEIGGHPLSGRVDFKAWIEDIEMLEGNCRMRIATDTCLLYTSPSPRDRQKSRMPSSA